MQRKWIITPDDRLCELCEQMTGERAFAPLDGQFDTPNGPMDGPPCILNAAALRASRGSRPMPKPKPGEKQSEWMGRCVPVAVEEGRPQKQAVAMCIQMWRDKDKKREARSVTLVGAVAEGIRTAQFSGREHLVVPVVALVGDSVISALGSAGPEFIPAAVVEASVSGWRGEPVMGDHPSSEDGRLLSANEPEVLEAVCLRAHLPPVYKDKRLTVEAYIDPELAVAAGAEGLLERLHSGQTVEVSIGAYVRTEARQGIHAGQRYSAVWTDILPDHLALLPEGSIGACSVAMGCGAPRAASYRITTTDLEEADDMTEKTFVERLATRLAALLGDPEVRSSRCACEETHQQSAESAQEEEMAEVAKVESAPALETVPTKPAEVPVAAAPVLPSTARRERSGRDLGRRARLAARDGGEGDGPREQPARPILSRTSVALRPASTRHGSTPCLSSSSRTSRPSSAFRHRRRSTTRCGWLHALRRRSPTRFRPRIPGALPTSSRPEPRRDACSGRRRTRWLSLDGHPSPSPFIRPSRDPTICESIVPQSRRSLPAC